MTQDELESMFADFGSIISSKILCNPKAGRILFIDIGVCVPNALFMSIAKFKDRFSEKGKYHCSAFSLAESKVPVMQSYSICYPAPSHPVGSDRNSSEVVGIPGIEFQQEVVVCLTMPESQDSGPFRHPTTSGWNPIPRIPTNSYWIRQSDYSSWVVLTETVAF